jgi:hypothetical protein
MNLRIELLLERLNHQITKTVYISLKLSEVRQKEICLPKTRLNSEARNEIRGTETSDTVLEISVLTLLQFFTVFLSTSSLVETSCRAFKRMFITRSFLL